MNEKSGAWHSQKLEIFHYILFSFSITYTEPNNFSDRIGIVHEKYFWFIESCSWILHLRKPIAIDHYMLYSWVYLINASKLTDVELWLYIFAYWPVPIKSSTWVFTHWRIFAGVSSRPNHSKKSTYGERLIQSVYPLIFVLYAMISSYRPYYKGNDP